MHCVLFSIPFIEFPAYYHTLKVATNLVEVPFHFWKEGVHLVLGSESVAT